PGAVFLERQAPRLRRLRLGRIEQLPGQIERQPLGLQLGRGVRLLAEPIDARKPSPARESRSLGHARLPSGLTRPPAWVATRAYTHSRIRLTEFAGGFHPA